MVFCLVMGEVVLLKFGDVICGNGVDIFVIGKRNELKKNIRNMYFYDV